MRVPVQPADPHRAGEQRPRKQQADPVALDGGAVRDDLRHRSTGDPLGDQHPVGDLDDVGYPEVGVVAEGVGEGSLSGGLLDVVDLVHQPRSQLGEQGEVSTRPRPARWPAFSSPLRSTALTARIGRLLGISV